MKYLTILISIIIFTTTTCNKLDVPKSTPGCIKSKIKKIQSDPVRNPPASVWRYDYNGQTVYYIPPYCCDIPSELYDSDCNLICKPDGGLTGTGDNNCTDFFSKRTNEKLIWQDNRN